MTELNTPDQTVFIPQSIGAYRIDRELGAGAMGTVYYAIHTGLDRAVALKVLRPDMVQDPDSVRRFLREARAIARLEHPHIVSVYDAGEADDVSYIAMKLLTGRTLQSVLAQNGTLPLNRVVNIASQLASALDFAHQNDVVHLDVKPANVMIADGDRVTLTDFGIAQALNPGATRSATIAGTPLYMSPEQIQGLSPDRRSDIYSLGLVIYEMCVGHPPFQGQMVTVMYAHLHTPVPDIREFLPEAPEALRSVLDRALVKNRDERFQTAGELLHALEAVAPDSVEDAEGTVIMLPDALMSAGTDAPTQTGAVPAQGTIAGTQIGIDRRSRLLRPLIAACGVVVVLVAALVAYTQLTAGPATGSVAIASVPPGAAITLDGKREARAPTTLPRVPKGHHILTFSLPTYFTRTVNVQVHGGDAPKLNVSLRSWPYTRMLSTSFLLSGSVSRDPKNPSHINFGPAVNTIHVQRQSTTVYPVSQMQLTPAVAGVRALTITPSYTLYDPNGIPIASLPQHPSPLKLDSKNPTGTFSLGFVVRKGAVLGTWTVKLVANGEILATKHFTTVR